MKKPIIGLAFGALIVISAGVVYKARAHSPKQEALAIFHKWENSVQRGDTGFAYWSDSVKAAQLQKRLFAVRACKVLAVYPGETADRKYAYALVVTRIDSSTKGGFPITADWNFFIKRTENGWKIDSITQDTEVVAPY